MQKNNLKKYSFISNYQSEMGFTIIEMLLAFSIILIILTIIPSIWKTTNLHRPTERFSVYQFFHFISDQVHENKLTNTSDDQILLTTIDGDFIRFSMHNNLIRRQVNRSGHEVFLQNVATLRVTTEDDYLLLTLTMESGGVYEKVIHLFSQ
ncbi:ComGF family competence protein [Amphibacillus jilinensis]|uniref:ComGF family competence protein n=1 Tax=Amphibacillus jilinensis TaxID=1216008 RepID=UPI000A071D0B|nr:ComGF family competence protein [Amphibacillus jilinensis]